MNVRKGFLIILDGWGIGQIPEADAIAQADTPYFDSLIEEYPHSTLLTHGMDVGLPEGQMGNSEVGHLNIGAGRVVYQELARINKAIAEDSLKNEATIIDSINYLKEKKCKIHILGLLSDGGVHSHIEHIKAVLDIYSIYGFDIKLHPFLDGRDTDPRSGLAFVADILDYIEGTSVSLATVIGRYYAMDRDHRWERTKKAYDLLVKGVGEDSNDILNSIEEYYSKDVTDEFMPALVIDNQAQIKDGDLVLFVNFRTDRPRQLTQVLTQTNFPDFGMKKLDLRFVTMTNYDNKYENISVVYEKDTLAHTMGKVISLNGLSQLRIAETEKYPHVTFFFSGGEENPEAGEERIVIASPKVDTYDLAPEMSAREITTALLEKIQSNSPDFICLNFANTDMVGHTGVFSAAKVAAQTVDECLSKIIPVALEKDYEILIFADHGNSDFLINEDGSPNTAHTKNPVPLIYVSRSSKTKVLKNGRLADIAPTLLTLMGIERPKEMTGNFLVSER